MKLVKRCLKKVIGNAHIAYEELETVVIEIEGVLNSRPLAYLYDDISEEPLTSSTLVIGHSYRNTFGVGFQRSIKSY